MIKFPVDFEQKVKLPAGPGGGYPVQISAKDLMRDFRFAALQVDTTPLANGLSLEERQSNGERFVKLTGALTSGTGWWGTVGILWQPAAAASPSEYVTLQIEVEDGRIIGVKYGQDGGSEVDGTQDSPGAAELVIQQ